MRSFDTGRSFDGEKLFASAENREDMQDSLNAAFLAGEGGSVESPPIEPMSSDANEIIIRENVMLGSPVILFGPDGLPDGGMYEVDDTLPEDGSLRLGVIVTGNTYSLFAGPMDMPSQFERMTFASIELLKNFNEWGEYDYVGNGFFSVRASENLLTHRGGVEMTFDFANRKMKSLSFTSNAGGTVRLKNIIMGESDGNGYLGMGNLETLEENFSNLGSPPATVKTEFFGDRTSMNPPARAITTLEGDGFSGAFALRGTGMP